MPKNQRRRSATRKLLVKLVEQENNLKVLREAEILLKRKISDIRKHESRNDKKTPTVNYFQQRNTPNGNFYWYKQYYENGVRKKEYAKDFDPSKIKESAHISITYHKDYKK